MQVSQPNDVKIYNLSAGKSLPEVRLWQKICTQGWYFIMIDILA